MRAVPAANVDAWVVRGDIRPSTREEATLYVPQHVAAPRHRRFPAVFPRPAPCAAPTKSATPVHATSEPITAKTPGRSQPRTATSAIATRGEVEFRMAA